MWKTKVKTGGIVALGLWFGAGSSLTAAVCERAELLASDGAEQDKLGRSVAISGDTVIAGARSHNGGNGKFSGAAYVFRWNGSTWIEEQKLLAVDGEAYDEFGFSVAIEGDIAAIGARLEDDKGNSAGAAYVFRRTGSTWVQEQKLRASDGAASDVFGSAVAISGDTILVGAHNDGNMSPLPGHGAAYVYRFNGSSWVQEQKLLPSDGALGDKFAFSVALSGDMALIGSYNDKDFGPETGAAYVFHRTGTTWVQSQKLLPGDAAPYSSFGFSVDVHGNIALIGALNDDTSGGNFGSAYVFQFNGSSWVEEAELFGSDSVKNCGFGWSVSVGNNVALIGEPRGALFGGAGKAYLFRKNGSNWVEEQIVVPSDIGIEDTSIMQGGISVALSGDLAVYGASAHSHPNFQQGAAYVFDLACDSTGPTVSITNPTEGSNVIGTTSIQTEVTGPAPIVKVNFYIDGILKRIDVTAPYTYNWNTHMHTNGPHTLKAVAVDAAGNKASEEVTINVLNP